MIPAEITQEHRRSIDEICASHAPEEDPDIGILRAAFSDDEWAALMQWARASLRAAVSAAVVAKTAGEAAAALGPVKDAQALRSRTQEMLNEYMEAEGEAEAERILQTRPRGALLRWHFTTNEAVAVASALDEIDEALARLTS